MLKTSGHTVCVLLLMARLASGQAAPEGVPPLLTESLGGRDSFEAYCAACHGAGGRGDGPIASALKTHPADLTSLARRRGGVYPRDYVRGFVTGTARLLPAHGTSEMPAWGPLFRAFESDARVQVRIDGLVAHIESLQGPSTLPTNAGAQLFRTYCATCHGSAGRGDGALRISCGGCRPTSRDSRPATAVSSRVSASTASSTAVTCHRRRSRDACLGGCVSFVPDGSHGQTRIDAIVTYLEGIQERGTH